ncbi:hypothetical protein DU002_02235 [Corallincola holothuriorum]|uniref:Uncharacterized protein n=3 Tax=Corallincola TaxID=1775176 RepID=A0A368NS88_9GAMM|nr:hypothetical protein DU002_02235 [Corallincola holothuriorum]
MTKGVKSFVKSLACATLLWLFFSWLTGSPTLSIVTAALVLSAGVLALIEELVHTKKSDHLVL